MTPIRALSLARNGEPITPDDSAEKVVVGIDPYQASIRQGNRGVDDGSNDSYRGGVGDSGDKG